MTLESTIVPRRSAMNLVRVRYKSYERNLPSSSNKLLPSLLPTVDVQSSVSAAPDTVTHKVCDQIVDVRPDGSPVVAVWTTGSLRTELQAAGKRLEGIWQGQQSPIQPVVDPNHITVAAKRTEAATVEGVFGEMETAMMLDLGSSIPPIWKDVLPHFHGVMKV